MVRIAIIDDDSKQQEMLCSLVMQFFQQHNLDFECTASGSALDFVSDYVRPYQIILMDIDMPHMDGMAAAKKLRQQDEQAVIIFVTRMSQYAVHGYEVDALDFLIKPVSPFKLYAVLEKALRKIPLGKTVAVISDRTTFVLNMRDILYVEGDNQYVIYHVLRGGKEEKLKVHASMKVTEPQLEPGFSRCNKSYIVNLSHITKVDESGIRLGETVLPISRTFRRSFLSDLNRFFAGL